MTVAIIQARITSSRLPGKVLMTILGRPILWYVVERTGWATLPDQIIVATSTDPTDDPIVQFCQKEGIRVFRGSLTDVLSRYYYVAKEIHANVVVRVTADCPLIDGGLIDSGIKLFSKERCDYLSNTVKRTFPKGFDFEVLTFQALEKAYQEADKSYEREHVTPYIWQNCREEFRLHHFKQNKNKSTYRVTVDTPEDLQLVKILIENYQAHKMNYQEITVLLEAHPELAAINAHVRKRNLVTVQTR